MQSNAFETAIQRVCSLKTLFGVNWRTATSEVFSVLGLKSINQLRCREQCKLVDKLAQNKAVQHKNGP